MAAEGERTGPGEGPPGVGRRAALRLIAVSGVAAGLGGGALGALVRRGLLQRVEATRTRMGTLVEITVVHPDGEAAHALVEAAFAEMGRLEGVLSRHRPDTPVARLNRDGWVGPVPPELLEVVRAAQRYAELSGGAFDVTVAPLVDLYAARFRDGGVEPAPDEVARVRSHVGWRSLLVDEGALAFEHPAMSLTLDGIAKGFIVDRTVAVLGGRGADRILVDAGGDVGSSPASGSPWRIAIRHPREAGASLGVVELRGTSVASSGDYVQAFALDRSRHHIVDPRSGRSPTEVAAATVVAPSAMDADALSTTAMVLGAKKGLALLESQPRVEGLLVTKKGDVLTTPGFRRG